MLTSYFAYSIDEGARIGRSVHLVDARLGVAVWLMPQPADVRRCEEMRKREFLRDILGARDSLHYERIVDYMRARADTIVVRDAWYLSIVAVAPEAQGQGLGRRLLTPTLAEWTQRAQSAT
ncbi:MAG: N-acetyltransferase [Myxococcales bacterium]|nr:N-acetyltransferase [Myxococcales bacterium]